MNHAFSPEADTIKIEKGMDQVVRNNGRRLCEAVPFGWGETRRNDKKPLADRTVHSSIDSRRQGNRSK
jgi:hypothetical protein